MDSKHEDVEENEIRVKLEPTDDENLNFELKEEEEYGDDERFTKLEGSYNRERSRSGSCDSVVNSESKQEEMDSHDLDKVVEQQEKEEDEERFARFERISKRERSRSGSYDDETELRCSKCLISKPRKAPHYSFKNLKRIRGEESGLPVCVECNKSRADEFRKIRCCECLRNLPTEQFSNSQRARKGGKQCLDCVAKNSQFSEDSDNSEEDVNSDFE
ncbi:hypothetical protein HK098_002434 [Nowakowskiella sp. JEL0407]|nr:hypothetical protein HK098_002434 [Nowakowskiella sp. JEL0407]